MADYTRSKLWKQTLADQGKKDPYPQERARLRDAYIAMRDRAKVLAGEINRSLPEFTVHDIDHMDALWQMADLITGDKVKLTPTEGFVLGGAFLIHDLGMGIAAYPDGIDQLKSHPLYAESLIAYRSQKLDRPLINEQKLDVERESEIEAIEEVLRRLHAEQASKLALVSWRDPAGGSEYFLIDNPDIREDFGSLIGEIAHSHWWSIDRLTPAFREIRGAPGKYPDCFEIDPLKLACLMRLSDVIHLDDRRAPGFLRAVRKPSVEARKHWLFQSKLNRPRLEYDRMKFTSKSAFLLEDAPSWWLCYDALKQADKELRDVDTVLQDLHRSSARFMVRGIARVETPDRLREFISVSGWTPADTTIKVTRVAELVQNLGGKQLYGDSDRMVPLRELIQNASDSIRAYLTK